MTAHRPWRNPAPPLAEWARTQVAEFAASVADPNPFAVGIEAAHAIVAEDDARIAAENAAIRVWSEAGYAEDCPQD